MSEDMKKALACMQETIDEELERKAKLGYNVVIGDKNGNPMVLSAKSVWKQRKQQIVSGNYNKWIE